MSEMPGAQTPWTDINQLLAPDERFEVNALNGKGFLLAPKHISQLAALLYLIFKQGLAFCVQGRGTTAYYDPHHSLIVSARAFSQLILHENEVVEAGAGCSLSHLHQFLFERKQEVALEEDPLSSSKQSIGGLILSGRTSGICYRQEQVLETILGIEFVTWDGSQIKWGGNQRSSLAGPAMHKLVWGLNSFPGVIVNIILKTYPIPQKRLKLAWAFRQKEALWKHFQSLKTFSYTWESLEWVLSGQAEEQGFVFAQLSGSKSEMEAFSQLCPSYPLARQQDERLQLKNFMKQKSLKVYSVSNDQKIETGEYLWHQELDQRTWWMTNRCLKEKIHPQPLWKQRFWKTLCQSEET